MKDWNWIKTVDLFVLENKNISSTAHVYINMSIIWSKATTTKTETEK